MEWTRREHGGLHHLDIPNCPIRALAELARFAGVDVTVENVRPVRYWNEWFESNQSIPPEAPVRRHRIRNAIFDLALKNEEFLGLMSFWDANGVYAIFTERSPIPFRASDLKTPARYHALANFGFVLEFALAGPASAGVSGIVTPRSDLADLAETILREG